MNRQLDVLFVNPNSSRQVYQGLASTYTAIEPPVWALLLAQSCRAAGYDVAILDCQVEQLTDWQALAKIHEIDPRLVVFVVYGSEPNAGTKNMAGAVSLCQKLKTHFPEYKTMFIGSHVSALPMDVLSLSYVDFISINEGVHTLRMLLEQNLVGSVAVPGLGWKGDQYSKHVNWGMLTSQEALDDWLPGYAWDLLPKKNKPLDLYRSHFWHGEYDHAKRTPFAAIYTSLGCRFKCDFCMINLVNRIKPTPGITAADSAQMRWWTPEHSANQITKLVEMGVTTIRLSDEMFFLDKRHWLPLLTEVKARHGDSLRMWAYARVDTVRPDHLELFRSAGIRWLCLGIESGNQTVRREVTKGSYEEVDIRQVVKDVENAGIEVIANYIFGLPDDTMDSMWETLDLSIELNTSMWNAYPCMALPGSPLYQQATQRGIPLPDSYEGYSFHSYECLPLPTKTLTPAQVLKFRDEAFRVYWGRPAFQDKLESKFGSVAKKNVQELLKVKLRRKILGDPPPEGQA